MTDQERKRRMDTEKAKKKYSVNQITKTKEVKMDTYLPDQPQDKESKRKHKTDIVRDSSDSVQLSDGQNFIDQSQECVEVSSWMTGYPDVENNSEGGAGVDPQSEEGITNYERRPRKLCVAKKRLGTPRVQKEQLDKDSEETVNSEPVDRDNSSEKIPARFI
ncbi:uncharacterized protein Hap1MRO34_004917 [Clarias gariepinus]